MTYSLEDQLIHTSRSTTIPKIEFRGNTYSAKTNNDGDYSNEDWQDVTKFTINKAQDIEIPTDKISCGDYVPYIRYKGNTYDILTSGDTRYIVVDSEIKYEKCLEKLKKYIVSGNVKLLPVQCNDSNFRIGTDTCKKAYTSYTVINIKLSFFPFIQTAPLIIHKHCRRTRKQLELHRMYMA